MAKSMRCKRVKRLRAIRRDMVEPFYDKKDEAKLAAQEAALNAPKLPVKPSKSSSSSSMEVTPFLTATSSETSMDVEMGDGSGTKSSLKALGGIGKKKALKAFKVGKRRKHGKGKGSKVKKRHI